MADGKITIDIIANDTDINSAVKNLNGLSGAAEKSGRSIKNMALALGAVKLVSVAFNTLKNSIGTAVERFDTMQKFPKVLKALGYSTDDANKSMDKLSKGIDGLPTTLQDVVAQTQQMTAVTGDLGKSTDTVIALNNAFLASGASTEDASRGMQQFNQMLSTGTVDLEAWKTLQETMPLALQKTAEAMGYTGKTAQRDLYSALKEGAITFEDFQNQLVKLGTGTGDLAALAKENSLGIGTSFQNLQSAVTKGMANVLTSIDAMVQKLSGKSIASHIDSLKFLINETFTSINNAIQKATPYIQMFIDKISLMKPYVQDVIGKMLELKDTFISFSSGIIADFFQWFSAGGTDVELFKAAIISTISAIAAFKAAMSVITLLNNLNMAFMACKGAILAVNAVLLANPFVAVGAAIVGLVAGIVYLWKTNEGFRDAVINIWNAIYTFLEPVITEIANTIKAVWEPLSEWWQVVQASFFSIVADIWNTIRDSILSICTELSVFIQNVWSTIASWWTENQSTILNITKQAWDAIKNTFEIAFIAIKLIVSVALTTIQTTWQIWSTVISTLVKVMWSVVSNVFTTTLNVILIAVKSALNLIKSTFDLIMNTIKNVTKIALSVMKGDWSGVLSGIKGIVSGFGSFVRSTFSNMMSSAINAVSAGISGIKGVFNSLSNIDLGAAGRAIMNSFLNGLMSAYESVKSFVGGIASWIKEHKGPISYDRKLLIPAGKAIMTGFDESLQNQFKSVQNTISGMGAKLTSTFENGGMNAEMFLNAKGTGFNGNTTTNNSTHVTNTPTINMTVNWSGEQDIRKTMQKIGWLTNIDMKGAML